METENTKEISVSTDYQSKLDSFFSVWVSSISVFGFYALRSNPTIAKGGFINSICLLSPHNDMDLNDSFSKFITNMNSQVDRYLSW